jgi:hypothetical protein
MGLKNKRLYVFAGVVLVLSCVWSCKKQQPAEDARIEPPVRTYIVTARIDKKGTNSTSDGTGVLKGSYDEQSKIFIYLLEYENIKPFVITLRSGIKGTAGEMIREIYKNDGSIAVKQPISGSLKLSPLQERNLLKGLWFVAIGTGLAAPEISGSVTLKQK